jgi:hypothetical protein
MNGKIENNKVAEIQNVKPNTEFINEFTGLVYVYLYCSKKQYYYSPTSDLMVEYFMPYGTEITLF